MVSADDIIRLLRKHIVGADTELTGSSPLLGVGLLDSLSLVTLMASLEEEYGIRVGALDVTDDNFATPRALAAFVNTKIARK